MYGYASLLGVAKANGYIPYLASTHPLLTYFPLTKIRSTGAECLQTVYDDRPCTYNPLFFNLPAANISIEGYLQSWKYFRFIEDEIRREFKMHAHIKTTAKDQLNSYVGKYLKEGRLVISIHVRRGDVLTPDAQKLGFRHAPASYFQNAMSHMLERYPNSVFFVTSDDIVWCKENLKSPKIYSLSKINSNRVKETIPIVFSASKNYMEDFAMLTLCNHSIISVGTFGWWSAWLANGHVVYYKDFPIPGTKVDFETKKEDFFPTHWQNGWTWKFIVITFCAYLIIPGISYTISSLNAPAEYIKHFINTTKFERYHSYPDKDEVDSLFGLLVALVGLGAVLGKLAILVASLIGLIGVLLMGLSRVASSYEMLFIGRVLTGVTLGSGLSVAPAYAVEMSLPSMKGSVALLNQLFQSFSFVISQVMGYIEILGNEEHWDLLVGKKSKPYSAEEMKQETRENSHTGEKTMANVAEVNDRRKHRLDFSVTVPKDGQVAVPVAGQCAVSVTVPVAVPVAVLKTYSETNHHQVAQQKQQEAQQKQQVNQQDILAESENFDLYDIEELEGSEFSNYENAKNPGHKQFIPIQQLSMKHLPEDHRDELLLNCIRAVSNLTVKLKSNIRQAHLCVLANSVDEPLYTKLIEALCAEHGINLLKVDDAKKLGEWAGLCKLDKEGKARKVNACGAVVVKDYGKDSQALDIVKNYFKSK
ncbi:hypothetical protein Btru_018591 [Bulinus truncatus]|nr:hypothetical protein Btru_018591 [Bulinus truncatus]